MAAEPARRIKERNLPPTAMHSTAFPSGNDARCAEGLPAAQGGDARLSRYLTNLAALYRADAALAARVDQLPFAEAPELESARDGRPTIRVAVDDGGRVYAHSQYQPEEEARRAVAALNADANPTIVIAGCGLGYHLVALESRFERPLLIVFEPDPALLKAAFCTVDLAGPLRDGRLIFITTADKAALHEKLLPRHADILLGVQFLRLAYSERCGRDFHARVRELLADFVAYARMQMVTLLRNARITARNVAYNLPTYVSRPGIEALQGCAAGRPAIVIAAGPSLARSLDLLPGLRDRAVLIAVQTVFKLLLARGVRPHFVTSLDYHAVSGEFFRACGDVGDCTLVAEAKATWHVVDQYPGRVRLVQSRFADALLGAAAPRRAALKAGSTVAHLAFYLAQYLGCDPIILVGQDLCFSDGLYYPPGMPIEDIWRPELGRFQTVEMKQWERIVRGRPILRRVRDVQGREAVSDDQLVSYAEQFASDFAGCGRRVILTGGAGMRLAGAQAMALQDAAAQYCATPAPIDWLPRAAAREPEGSLQRAAAALVERQEEVAALRAIAEEMRPLLERLTASVDDPSAFNRLIVRVDELRTRIRQYERTYSLVVDVSQQAELQRYGADRRIGARDTETAVSAAARLQRDRAFVEAFIEGCAFLEELLPVALERLREGGT
jgi:hypothetical protein